MQWVSYDNQLLPLLPNEPDVKLLDRLNLETITKVKNTGWEFVSLIAYSSWDLEGEWPTECKETEDMYLFSDCSP